MTAHHLIARLVVAGDLVDLDGTPQLWGSPLGTGTVLIIETGRQAGMVMLRTDRGRALLDPDETVIVVDPPEAGTP